MAWRQQNSGVPAFRPNQTNRPVFEDFDPKIDTNENEGARIVALHVPGLQFSRNYYNCCKHEVGKPFFSRLEQ